MEAVWGGCVCGSVPNDSEVEEHDIINIKTR